METPLEILESEALKLTLGERAALAQRLLASLDEDAQIEDAWAAEIERRIAEVESGAVQVIPIACVRHTMSSERRQYAEASQEDAERNAHRTTGFVDCHGLARVRETQESKRQLPAHDNRRTQEFSYRRRGATQGR